FPIVNRMPCPICDDSHWKPIDENGVRRVVRCDCWYDRLSERCLSEAKIPKRYTHCTLDNFRAYNDSLREAIERARAFVERFPGGTDRGLLLLGHAGVGKTHIAVAVSRAVIVKTGTNGLFYDTGKLLAALKS